MSDSEKARRDRKGRYNKRNALPGSDLERYNPKNQAGSDTI
jgi:hypothetical protein